MLVANPIYDIVFKYLMEDERIARTILSALLKKEVSSLELRPYKYDNRIDTLSVFRLDILAKIHDKGQETLILIVLQKTWIGTKSLQLRQYLNLPYKNPNNKLEDGEEHNLPVVAIYLLCHKVGDIEEPVLYVKQKPLDYNGYPVMKGLPNTFVDSRTCDSIIVQIPRLSRHATDNRLYKMLSLFDQTHQCQDNHQMLEIDGKLYEDDTDLQPIILRLLMAATDPTIRHMMNNEDLDYSIFEKYDTEIMMKDKKIEELNIRIAEQKIKLNN